VRVETNLETEGLVELNDEEWMSPEIRSWDPNVIVSLLDEGNLIPHRCG